MKTRTVASFGMPRLGGCVHRFDPPWKVCGMGFTRHGLMATTCNNSTRRHSRVYRGGNLIHDDWVGKTSNETIGNPFEAGGMVGLVGENGRLWTYDGNTMQARFETHFANAIAKFKEHYVVLDTDDGKIEMRDALRIDGESIGRKPGDGIAMAACEFEGKLYAAVADGTEAGSGLSCSDGRMIPLPACQCVIQFADMLVYSSGNRVFVRITGQVAELDCEKIMDMKVAGNHLYIAGANPDSLWVANARGEIYQIIWA